MSLPYYERTVAMSLFGPTLRVHDTLAMIYFYRGPFIAYDQGRANA